MKKTLIVLIAAIVVGISIYTVNNYNTSNDKPAKEATIKNDSSQSNSNKTTTEPTFIKPDFVKTKALDFKLKNLEGTELSLSDLKGKKVFLNFWATWCPPCKAEMPEIEKLYQETKNSDLVIVAVEIGEPLATVKPFIDGNKYNFKVLLDSDQSVAAKYNISSIPTSYFIDVDGNIVSKRMGGMNIEQMKAAIKDLDK